MSFIKEQTMPSPELTGLFNQRSQDYMEKRTRKAIEDNIQLLLRDLHAQYFRTIGGGSVSVTTERENNVTVFYINVTDDQGVKIDKNYEGWQIRINMNPFIRNYDIWMKGGNDEWKAHVKPFAR